MKRWSARPGRARLSSGTGPAGRKPRLSRFEVRATRGSNVCGGEMDSPDPSRRGRARDADRPPPRRRPRSPRTPAGSTPGSTAGGSRMQPSPPTSPSSTIGAEPRRAPRRRWPRRLPADRRRTRPRTGAGVRGGGLGGHPRYLAPAAAASPARSPSSAAGLRRGELSVDGSEGLAGRCTKRLDAAGSARPRLPVDSSRCCG